MKRCMTLFVALGAASLAACQDEQHVEAQPRPVLSVVVAPQSAKTVGFAGTIEARFKSDLGFRVLGRIVTRDVEVADVVKKGQRLATLDPLIYRLAVQSAKADLASANAQQENAAGTEVRQRTLFEKNVTPQSQFEAARQGRESAEAGVTRARANLMRAEEQLGYTELRADFDGVVTSVRAEVGQVVQPGQTVLSLARQNTREAVIDLPESIGRGLTPGAAFDIALQLDPTIRTTGVLREVAPQADATTRTVRVRITLDESPASFRLGTTVTAAVTTQTTPDIELPTAALLERDGRTMVWVVDAATKTVSTRDVTIVARDAWSIRVANELPSYARVVTAGVNSLTFGQKVKIADEKI